MNGPFDYNKMPLAPMGSRVQVHEKTDKRGTWAFHSVDGWYIATSPEHYRTHRCHIKSTNSDRLSDTVQFQHKSITNPTATHADKLMQAIDDCNQVIKGTSNNIVDTQLQLLQQVLQKAKQKLMKDPTSVMKSTNATTSESTINTQAVPRVASNDSEPPPNDNQRITRAMANRQQPTTAAQPIAPPRAPPTRAAAKQRRRHNRVTPLTTPTTAPAMNTRAKRAEAVQAVAPPANRTRAKQDQRTSLHHRFQDAHNSGESRGKLTS